MSHLAMLTNAHLPLQPMPEAIFMLDTAGRITYANLATSALTGYSVSDLLTQHLSVLYANSEKATKTDYDVELALNTGKFSTHIVQIRNEMTPFWAELLLAPIYNAQSTCTGYSCLLRDMAQYKDQELELPTNEEKYGAMVDNIKDHAIFLLDPTGHILTWNQGASQIKGYSMEEAVGRHFSMLFTPQDLLTKKPEQELTNAIQTGQYEEEGWRVKKNGFVFWANIVLTALYTQQHQLIGFSKITRDLTPRKQSEDWHQALVEQVLDYGIFMLDEQGNILSWNEGAKRIKGYSREEIIGENFAIFYLPEDSLQGKPLDELRVAKAAGRYEDEGWRVRKDGSLFWANVVITAVYTAQGTLIGFSKVTRDLTERRRAEKALEESHERYRLLAEELSGLNRVLSSTNQDLQRSNENLHQFAQIVSHDLQEPLRKIRFFGELLKSQPVSQVGAGLDALERMQSAAQRMSVLIRDLLQYAQLTTFQKAFKLVSLTEVVDLALSDLELVIAETGAQVTIEPLPLIKGDASQLGQLIQNLLSNALKFHRPNQVPRIHVRAHIIPVADIPPTIRPAQQATRYVCLEVMDNGIGFDEKYLDRIFKAFQRLHDKHTYAGTGIGLAICEKIAFNHGGAITATSQPGQGATFSIYLPG